MILALALACNSGVLLESDDDTDGPRGAPPLVVNEIMPRNTASWAGSLGAYPDWIELFNPTPVPVPLEGWSIADSAGERALLDASLTVPAGGWLLLEADDSPELGAAHLPFGLSGDGDSLALYAPDGTGAVVTWGPLPDDVAIARIPNGCPDEACWGYAYGGTPGVSNDVTEPTIEEIVPKGSAWRYLDAGEAPSGWARTAFDDGAWPSGAGPLGYGDPHIVTTVGFGPDEANKRVTTYFRLAFTLEEAAISGHAALLCDDGAAVYLDGTEVWRANLPSEPLSAETLALVAIGYASEVAYSGFDLPEMAAGPHVLAVEVHQAGVASSDLGFDLTLEVTRP